MPISRIGSAGVTAPEGSVEVADPTVTTAPDTIVVPEGIINDGLLDTRPDEGSVVVATDDLDLAPERVTSSKVSATAYHSTLFEDFSLRAEAVYNYYTEDERTNDRQDENAPAYTLPRYIELFWRTAPTREVLIEANKTVRPLADLGGRTGSVLGVKEAVDSSANGFISPGVIDALLVEPVVMETEGTFIEDQFLQDPDAGGLSASSVAVTDDSYTSAPAPDASLETRVSFIDPSIAGALDANRISLSEDQVYLTNLGSLSKLLSSLEVISEFNQDVPPQNPPPVFPAPSDAPTLTYVGYLIERHEVGPDGSMRLTRLIEVNDPSQGRFVDRQVKFGTAYAYRIRTAIQWTHPPDVGFSGPSTVILSPTFDAAAGTPRKDASFYAGDWSQWARAEIIDNVLPDPPDELTVRPISHRGMIDVVWKMPNDPQRDVRRVRLLRCVERDGRLGPWKQLGEFPVGNGRYVDRDVRPHEESGERYVYAMYSVSHHGEVSILSEQVEARLAANSRRIREFPLRQVAPRGYDPMGESYACRVPERDWNIIARGRVGFYVRHAGSVHPLTDRTYVVEVKSLSTGERAHVRLSVDSTDVAVGTGPDGRRA